MADYHPNPDRELVCCLRCGRDTTNVTSLCRECGGTWRREKPTFPETVSELLMDEDALEWFEENQRDGDSSHFFF